MTHDSHGSFNRWQAILIGQLTYAIDLILGFAVAVLGFQVTLLLNEKFIPVSWQRGVFSLSLLLLVVAVLLGIAAIINRLRDFRATTNAARARESGDAILDKYRDLYLRLGPITWRLFWCQLGAFGAGVILTFISVLASARHKLF